VCLVAFVSVAGAFTSPLPAKTSGNQKYMMASSSNEETSRRRFLGSVAAITALFPQVGRAAPTKKVGGGLASKIRSVGNVMVRSYKSMKHALYSSVSCILT
jgi:hypothetical protein